MKLIRKILAIGIFFCLTHASAQVYQGAVGLGLDVGDGPTLVGPSGKYFFAAEHAGLAEVLFGDGITGLTFLYQYHGGFAGAENLQWFAGAGPTILFGDGGNSDVGIRPNVGLDFKIPDVPLAFSFDWRPYISFEDNGTEMARFGLGFRYAFN